MIGLYIHIPFCRKKCFYCSFCVAVNQLARADDYARCLAREAERFRGEKIASVYFGGGTPSLLTEEQAGFLMTAVRRCFLLADDAEMTVEMNPEDVSSSLLACYRALGVTRVSIGVQTFDDRCLKFFGRGHTGAQGDEALRLARRSGIETVSADVIYGFPAQTVAEIGRDLARLRDRGCDHVSLYSLSVEPGSRFFVDRVALPAPDEAAQQYVFVRDWLTASGFEHYEVSNFARGGRFSRHNLNYWQGGNYLGLGAAAHSHQDGRRWWNVPRLLAYIEKTARRESALEGEETLLPAQRLGEALVMGLRVIRGVDVNGLEKKFGVRLSASRQAALDRFIREKYLKDDAGVIALTDKGLLVLDELSPYLV